ncbi:MAG: Glucodextranase, domain [Candidatus Parcubacteria bacterium]|jgi:hypothetical protein
MTLGYTDGKTKIKIIFFTLCILGICGLTAYELRKVLRGPNIVLTCGHCDHITSDANTYTLEGQTSNISEIHLGNKKIYISSKGEFAETVLLYPGENMLSLHAKDRFGKEVKKDVIVYYKGEAKK